MNAEEWPTDAPWTELYPLVQKRKNARKMRVFGCACCRRLWDVLTEPVSRTAVETGERFADWEIGKQELTLVRRAANKVIGIVLPHSAANAHQWAASAAEMVTHATLPNAFITSAYRAATAVATSRIRTRDEEIRLQSPAFHDIFGNPFRPVAFADSWRSESAVALARTAYDTRNFTLLPILADALEEAGCDHADVLTHCRGPGPHVRGCWVVDQVLGKQ